MMTIDMHNRRLRSWPLYVAVIAAFIQPVTSPAVHAAEQPNIIFLFTDDQAPGMTGFEGNTVVKTPHLDQLAAESIQFTRCYVPTPQCAPSRASVLTGRYPHATGVTTNGPTLDPSKDTFTERLKRAGYDCGVVGKWHLSYENAPKPGFGLADFVATCDKKWSWENCDIWTNGQKGKADKFLTDWIADRAIEFIDKPHDKPFFLWVCFRAPHGPLTYPPATENLYPPASVDLPETMGYELTGLPRVLTKSEPAMRFRQKNEQQIREARSKYYAMITHLDKNIGRILERVNDRKSQERTVVVFASDNGFALGEHRLFSKGPAFFEELVRIPLLVRYPALSQTGQKNDRVVSLIDLAPTFLELAGLDAPVTMQGTSLIPIIKNPKTRRHSDESFFEYHEQGGGVFPVRGLVTKQYKFIDYLESDDILYDLKRDPQELHNAINDVEYRAIIEVLRIRLRAWQKQTKDPEYKGAALGFATPVFP